MISRIISFSFFFGFIVKYQASRRGYSAMATYDEAAKQGRDAAMKGVDAAKKGGEQVIKEADVAADNVCRYAL